jgi:hypothetical protein
LHLAASAECFLGEQLQGFAERRANAPFWTLGLSDWARAFWQPILGGGACYIFKYLKALLARIPSGGRYHRRWRNESVVNRRGLSSAGFLLEKVVRLLQN